MWRRKLVKFFFGFWTLQNSFLCQSPEDGDVAPLGTTKDRGVDSFPTQLCEAEESQEAVATTSHVGIGLEVHATQRVAGNPGDH